MGIAATALSIALEAFRLAPQLINGARDVIEAGKKIWETATAEEDPTPEQRQQYDAAEAAAFAALMESTKDVAEEGDTE